MATVCLCMIVKNEARVIRRCLESVASLIDSYTIVDTGSTDGTQGIIREFMANIPGQVIDRPWVNHMVNRNESLELAKEKFFPDYLYVIDAHNQLVTDDLTIFKNLTLDAYELNIHYGDLIYPRIGLISSKKPWAYRGVLHEVLCLDQPYTCSILKNCYVQVTPDGARSSDPEKYLKDIEILKQGLLDEPGNSRYQFYLAQSYRDAGKLRSAMAAYALRATQGGWPEEVWYSLYQIAKLAAVSTQEYAYSDAEIFSFYMKAINYRPSRAEAYGNFARYLRSRELFNIACLFAEKGMAITSTADKLFVEGSFYDWICQDEFAISAYWCGRYREALEVNERLLSCPLLPNTERSRIYENLAFCSLNSDY